MFGYADERHSELNKILVGGLAVKPVENSQQSRENLNKPDQILHTRAEATLSIMASTSDAVGQEELPPQQLLAKKATGSAHELPDQAQSIVQDWPDCVSRLGNCSLLDESSVRVGPTQLNRWRCTLTLRAATVCDAMWLCLLAFTAMPQSRGNAMPHSCGNA